MIRLATAEELTGLAAADEAAVRIDGLFRAYGEKTAFLRFYAAEQGALLAVMENTATVAVPPGVTANSEELGLFFAAQPDIVRVRSTAAVAQQLTGFSRYRSGAVLEAATGLRPVSNTQPLSPRQLYSVLAAAFGRAAPAFEGWYVDVSHRMRHGCCRSAGVTVDGQPVACALTVAETDTAAVIGGVATRPAYRQRGYAHACVAALTAALQAEHKRVLIAPQDEKLQALYAGWGFVPAGTWSEWER